MSLGRRDAEPNLEHLIQMAIRTAEAGNVQSAMAMVENVLESDKRNERAWMLKAKYATNEVDRRRFLETILEINPRNQQARSFLKRLDTEGKQQEGSSMRFGVILLVVVAVVLIIAIVAAVAIA
jgi:Flp pilus assembly protein TadB